MLLASQGVDDRCLQGFGELHQLVMRALPTAAAEQRDAPGLVEEIGQLVELLVGGQDSRLRRQKSIGNGADAFATGLSATSPGMTMTLTQRS